MKKQLVTGVAFAASFGVASADISTGVPLVDEGFEQLALRSIHGQGVWTDPWNHFQVVEDASAAEGGRLLRVDTTNFGDFNVPGFSNRWGGWIAFAQAPLHFAPRGDVSVLSVRAFVRVRMPDHAYTRDVRAGVLLEDRTLSPVADIGVQASGLVRGAVAAPSGAVVPHVHGTISDRSAWTEVRIRLDLANGLGRFDCDGYESLVFSHAAWEITRLQLSVDGRPSTVMPFRPQGVGEFDVVRVGLSRHCEGDLTLDEVVDDADFEAFVRMYGIGRCDWMSWRDASCAADFNGDRAVDELDFASFVTRYEAFVCG